MLWLLLCLLPPVGCSRIAKQDVALRERNIHAEEALGSTVRPHIYYCRSSNMEDFSCWWHPLDNLTHGEQPTYVLTYSKDKGSVHECPDYVSSGPNSCHFDRTHTSIWKIYCMNVTAVTAHRNYTSKQHCLDVAEIVQTEAPCNLSYKLTDAGGDEMGHNVLLSWKYPVPSVLQYGWITLVYELQYRRVTEPDNWKTKHPLHDPHVELLGLPVGDYVVRVRCRSHNYGLWSRWSSTLSINIPGKPPAGKLLVLILATGVSVVALLVITFGVIPQSKRIKDYFLPTIPKPRIIGIDPLLLKKGNLDAINHHFSNFHSYRPPSYSEEVWDHACVDDCYFTTTKDSSGVSCGPVDQEKENVMVPRDLLQVAPNHPFTAQSSMMYMQSVPNYCTSPPDIFSPSTHTQPEMVTLPGTGYSVTVTAPDPVPPSTDRSPQDFYTCVQLMKDTGEVHLVPCLPSAYCQDVPPIQRVDTAEKEKKMKYSEHFARQNGMSGLNDGGYSERSEAAMPLLPVSVGN